MSEFVKPQSPLYSKENDAYFYPMTTVDQVVMEDGTRLNTKIDSLVRANIQLNYSVVGGSTEPENPTENMIWVNTDAEIVSHVISKNEPKNHIEGMVWIKIDDSSTVNFHKLKINDIEIDEVYPLFTKQCVGDAWVDKTAKSYQNGEWVNLSNKHFIFEEGKGVSPEYTVKSYFGDAYGFNISDDRITFCTDNRTGNHVWIEPMTNLAPYKNLFFEMTFTSRYTSAYTATIGAGVNIPTGEQNPGSFAAQASGIYNTARAVYQVPISNLDGDYYIKLAAFAMTGYIHNIWLEM